MAGENQAMVGESNSSQPGQQETGILGQSIAHIEKTPSFARGPLRERPTAF